MVDVRRSYRRWFAYRLGILLPAFLSAVAVILWMVLGSMAPLWLQVTTTSLALLVDMLLGYLLVQTFACAFFHARARQREARLLRSLLSGSRTAALASIGLLWALALVPELFREPASLVPLPPPEPRVVQSARWPSEATVVVRDGVPSVDAGLPSATARTEPVGEAPLRVELPESAAAVRPKAAGGQEPEDDDERIPRFRPGPGEGLKLELEPAAALGIDRPWLPDERRLEETLPLEVRLDVLSFSNDGAEAGGISMSFDLPMGRADSVRMSYFVAFVEEGMEGGIHGFRDEHVTLDYVKRLVGFTRHAPFDLAVSVGLSLDRFSDWTADAPTIEETARLSPHVGIEIGLWQAGPMGFSLSAGQTLPLNVTGGSASVTDVALVVHIALSEHVSVRAGYQLVFIRLRDYDGPIGSGRTSDDLDRRLSGPMLGLEVRF